MKTAIKPPTPRTYADAHPEVWNEARNAAVSLVSLQAYLSTNSSQVSPDTILEMIDETVTHLLKIKDILDDELEQEK